MSTADVATTPPGPPGPPDPPGPESPARPAGSLKHRALVGSAWTLVGYVGTQVMRLAANVVLAALLFPEAFGIMALVNVFLQGLQMFADIGIAPSIIHSRRGAEPRFLNTAFTIQVVRGIALWLASCVGAWPFARLMGEPDLVWMIPVAGLTSIILGLTSTSVCTLNRQLTLGMVTAWEIVNQVIGVAAIVAIAVFWRSVWALIVGQIVATIVRTLTSHMLIRGYTNRFEWDPAAARELFRFGRWIFFSTVLTFFAMQLDRLLVGPMLGTVMLGVYSIAAGFAMLGMQLSKKVGGRVGFPTLAEIVRDRPHLLASRLRTMRLALIGLCLVPLLPLLLFGPYIVDVLYDDRYADAGWMLQYLAGGAIIGAVATSSHHVFLATGETLQIVVILSARLVCLVAAALAGHAWGGAEGLVIGISAVELLAYPVLAYVLWRRKLWQPDIDLPLIGATIIVTLLVVSP